MTARQMEDARTALVYVTRISQPMIVQRTFTKYRRFGGKIDVKWYLTFSKSSNEIMHNLMSFDFYRQCESVRLSL